MKVLKCLAIEQRHGLAEIENKGDAGGGELCRVLDHALAAIGSDDADFDRVIGAGRACDTSLTCECCMAPGWKGAADLIVIESVVTKRLGGVLAIEHCARNRVGDAVLCPSTPGIGAASRPTVRHEVSSVAQQLEVVGDVAAAAAEFAPHLRHQERHVQHVDLVGQDMILEPVLEHHDGVEGHRAADQGPSRPVHAESKRWFS